MAENKNLIDLARFNQFRRLNIPYLGAIDLKGGTLLHVRTNIPTIVERGFHCKRFDLNMYKITHTVKKGDTISSVAAKLNFSVEHLVRSNNIKDANYIQVGEELEIEVDKEYIGRLSGYIKESKYHGTGGAISNSQNDDINVMSIIAQIAGWGAAGTTLYQYGSAYNRAILAIDPQDAKFVMKNAGAIRTYSNRFFGNQHVPKPNVTAGKAKYAKYLKVLKYVKGLGNGFGFLGLIVSGDQFLYAKTTEVRVDATVDFVFGVIGFYGPWGAGISTVYFIVDTYVEGGWKTVGEKMRDNLQQDMELNTRDGIWYGAHNHFK